MTKLKVQAFTVSIDGYGAGPRQSLKDPLGVGGESLHEWLLHTRTFKEMLGGEGGSTDMDDAFARRSFDNIGAWILGRNMFGPVRVVDGNRFAPARISRHGTRRIAPCVACGAGQGVRRPCRRPARYRY